MSYDKLNHFELDSDETKCMENGTSAESRPPVYDAIDPASLASGRSTLPAGMQKMEIAGPSLPSPTVEPSKSSRPAFWVGCSVMVNLLFGLLPCFSRYLSGKAPNHADTPTNPLTLVIVGQAGAAVIVLVNSARVTCFGGDADAPPGSGSGAHEGHGGGHGGRHGGHGGPINVHAKPGAFNNPSLIVLFGCLTCTRAICNILSATHTAAYNVQLVGMLAPFITAAISRVFTGEKLPMAMWPALVVSIAGAVMVILQQSPLMSGNESDASSGAGGGSDVSLGAGNVSGTSLGAGNESEASAGADECDASLCADDFIGMALQLCTISAQSFVRVIMQRSRGILSQRELLVTQYLFATVGVFFMLLFTAPTDIWAKWLDLSCKDWLVVLSFTVCCMWFAAEYQVATVRVLGPAFTASFQPLRLISTIAVSWYWLGEPVKGALGWIGLALVFLSMSIYLTWDLCLKGRFSAALFGGDSGDGVGGSNGAGASAGAGVVEAAGVGMAIPRNAPSHISGGLEL